MVQRPHRPLLLAFLGTLLILCPVEGFGQESGVRLRPGYLTSGRSVRQAFQAAAATAHQSTVRIQVDDRPIALGVIVDPDGWILTKASQLEPGADVTLADGKRVPFEWIGYHRGQDLALLRIAERNLPALTWEERDPPVGSWLITVAPRPEPLAIGVMSVGRRQIRPYQSHGVLGVSLESNDLPRIRQVLPKSGAVAAGLQEGDLIQQVDGVRIQTGQDLITKLRNYRPGDSVTLQIKREDRTLTIGVRLGQPLQEALSQMTLESQLNGPLSQRLDNFHAVYQQDGVIAPEDCGGPVLTLKGSAIGINIARAGRVATYVLPADQILPLLEGLKEGKFPPPAPPLLEHSPETPELPQPVE